MTPALDRDELARDVFVALCNPSGSNVPMAEWNHAGIARAAFQMADAFLDHAESIDYRPERPVAPPPLASSGAGSGYVPKVGDVVSLRLDTGDGRVRVVTSDEDYALVCGDASAGSFKFSAFGLPQFTYLRPATASERAAAGLPPAPAPVAERPEWVRVTGPANPHSLTVGKAYRVLSWDENGSPEVERDNGFAGWFLSNPGSTASPSWPSWEPCDAPPVPPPAATTGKEEAYLAAFARNGVALEVSTAIHRSLVRIGAEHVTKLVDWQAVAHDVVRDVLAASRTGDRT